MSSTLKYIILNEVSFKLIFYYILPILLHTYHRYLKRSDPNFCKSIYCIKNPHLISRKSFWCIFSENIWENQKLTNNKVIGFLGIWLKMNDKKREIHENLLFYIWTKIWDWDLSKSESLMYFMNIFEYYMHLCNSFSLI